MSSPLATTASPLPTSIEELGIVPAALLQVNVLPGSHWAEIGANADASDANDNDAESTLSADAASSTASLASSILAYRQIHGRTYHSERGNALYWGSNDQKANDSLDLIHHAFLLAFDDELLLAPLDNPKKVLDVGTGTGFWAMDFADAYPGCEVIGTDVSPIQPIWVPPNLSFEIEDYTGPWTFTPESFDYVHARYLGGTIVDWTAFFKEAYQVLRPGAWIESYEPSAVLYSDDDSIPPTSAMAQWGLLFWKGSEKTGRSSRIYEDGVQMSALKAAGFVDLHEKTIKLPIGAWPQDPKQHQIGLLVMAAILNDAGGFILFMTGVLGWSPEEVTVLVSQMRKMIRDTKYHGYYWGRVVYARKPFPGEVGKVA